MKLYSLLVYDEHKRLLFSRHNLEEVFTLFRSNVQKEIERLSSEVLQNIHSHNNYVMTTKIIDHEVQLYGFFPDKSYVLITDQTYPAYAVSDLVQRLQAGSSPEEIWVKGQKPALEKIKHDLQETMGLVITSLDQLQLRGEKLDELIVKTTELEAASRVFATQSQKLNRCCLLL